MQTSQLNTEYKLTAVDCCELPASVHQCAVDISPTLCTTSVNHLIRQTLQIL